MPPLPVPSGREVARVCERLGWSVARQRGSHRIPAKKDEGATVSVPNPKEVARDTLRSLLRAAGIADEAFISKAETVRVVSRGGAYRSPPPTLSAKGFALSASPSAPPAKASAGPRPPAR
ncbi:MAG: type II toxin-antitoxin system HicA family toxin [Chromatiaceae bacterium]|nr:type II toxin-antitoxin system HicA family toxin [Chromatiaceae bacterium]